MLTRNLPSRSLVTEGELQSWLASAKHGDVLEYHRGFLAIDRIQVGSGVARSVAEAVDRVAKLAMALSDTGQVHLAQRRHGDGDYSYIIVVRGASVARAGCFQTAIRGVS